MRAFQTPMSPRSLYPQAESLLLEGQQQEWGLKALQQPSGPENGQARRSLPQRGWTHRERGPAS